MPTDTHELERHVTLQDTRELAPAQPPLAAPAEAPRLQLSAIQILASALAAVTATIAASFLGVAGTVIGAAIASVVTVVGNALYSHSLKRTGARVRAVVPAAYRWPAAAGTVTAATTTRQPGSPTATALLSGTGTPPRPHRRGGSPLKRIAVAVVGVFAALCMVLTGIELATGKPISDLLTGKKASGTTLFGAATHARSTSTTPTTGTSTSSGGSGSTSSSSTGSASTSPSSTSTTTSTSPSTTPTTSTATTPSTSTSAPASTSPSSTDAAVGSTTPVN